MWEKQRGARLTGGERGGRIRHAPTGGRARAGTCGKNGGRAARRGKRRPNTARPHRRQGAGGGRVGSDGRAARAGHVKKQRGAQLTGGGRGGRIRHAPTGGRARAGGVWKNGGRAAQAGGVWKNGGRAARAGDVWENARGAAYGRGACEKRWARRAGGGRVGKTARAGDVWKNVRARLAGTAYGRGKRSCTEVPRPGSLSRRRSAPCSAAPCLTMDSPSPVPPAPPSGRAWLLSTR